MTMTRGLSALGVFFSAFFAASLLGGCNHSSQATLPKPVAKPLPPSAAKASVNGERHTRPIKRPKIELPKSWTAAEIRQLRVRKHCDILLVRWHGQSVTLRKTGQEAPNVMQINLAGGYSLRFPDPGFGLIRPRQPAEITLLLDDTMQEQVSVEQVFRQWIKERRIDHTQANEFKFLMDSDNLTGSFPSVQPVGTSALAVLDCYEPLGSFHITKAYFLVQITAKPHLSVLLLRPLARAASSDLNSDAAVANPPRLFLLNHHLLLQTDGKAEAIQPNGIIVRQIARF